MKTQVNKCAKNTSFKGFILKNLLIFQKIQIWINRKKLCLTYCLWHCLTYKTKFSSKRQLLLALSIFAKNLYHRWLTESRILLYLQQTLQKKLRFSLRISSVNVTKSAGILNEKLHFLCSDVTLGSLEFRCRIGYLSSENF